MSATPASQTVHSFDHAIALEPAGGNLFHGRTTPAYWNMIGPFGGITAATLLQAVLQHPERLGDPSALTVNFAGPIVEGPFVIEARPVRTNRNTQHWTIELRQGDEDDVSEGAADERANAPAPLAVSQAAHPAGDV